MHLAPSKRAERHHHDVTTFTGEGRQNLKDEASLHSMAKAFGIDISEFGDEAGGLWNKLNHLHASNPDSYRSFIQSQLKEGMQAMEGTQTQRVFTPEKGFVVKVFVSTSKLDKNIRYQKKKLFVNFCQHKVIDLPTDIRGGRVNKDSNNFNNLEIPLVVSRLRDFDNTYKGGTCTVDVVLNPWCFTISNSNNIFKTQIIHLGIKSVQEECEVDVQSKWKVIKSTYKGGVGPNMSDVHPFIVEIPKKDNKEEQDCPIMNDPCTLLRSLESKNEDAALDLNASTPNESLKISNAVLIEDITPCDEVSSPLSPKDGITLETQSPSKQEHTSDDIGEKTSEEQQNYKKYSNDTLSVQMKGFLNRDETHKPIYDVPSSGDGQKGTGGHYASFMARCNVVDTATLPSTIDAMQIDKQDPFSGLEKSGFLNNKQGSRCMHKKSRELGNFDAEFEDIVEKIDPRMSDTLCDCNAKTYIGETLQGISNVMKASEVSEEIATAKIQLDPASSHQTEDTVKFERSLKVIPNRLKKTIPHKICLNGDLYTLILDLSGFEVNDLKEIDLEVSQNILVLTTCRGGYLKYCHPQLSDNITAKFNRKRHKLKIMFPRSSCK